MLLVAVALTSACGSPPSDRASGAEVSSPIVSTPTASAAQARGAAASPAVASPAGPREVLGTVSVRQGNCLLFTPGDMAQSWVLTGAIDSLKPSHGYTLTGTLGPIDPACPQGPTFVVTEVVNAR